jgi:prefoldin subunit 5
MSGEKELRAAVKVLEERIKKYRTERDNLPDRQSSDLKANTLNRRINKLEAARREINAEARRMKKETP